MALKCCIVNKVEFQNKPTFYYLGTESFNAFSCFLDAPSSTKLTTDKLNDAVPGNGRIALTCTTDANPPVNQYRFYREGSLVQTTFTGKYIIHKARISDAGKYLCVPINTLGNGTSNTVTVIVYGQ